jgi:pyruvoyl-dependent arginine decarboxylase (PvlArgDC)
MAQGFGIDKEHKVSAYDNALYHMGLADQNMRYVSSVPPNTQLFDVLIRNGYSYIPVPLDYPSLHPKEWAKWKRHRQVVKGDEVYSETPGSLHQWYFFMGTSWCTDVVMTDMRGDSGERISSALGIGRYKRFDGSKGVFAYESHGYLEIDDSVDNAIEGLLKMIEMRGHEPLRNNTSSVIPPKVKEYPLAELYEDVSDEKKMRYATKGVYYSEKWDMEAYVTSMVVPEGHCGAVLTACVFDPFTEITANYF